MNGQPATMQRWTEPTATATLEWMVLLGEGEKKEDLSDIF
jgi:hypothetical protein